MQFSAEIYRRSENIPALGDFSKLIGEKSPIRRQRVNAVTWICDWHAWFSLIYIFIIISNNTFCNLKFWSLE
jgi:hypothetical protein